jgi:hypothetical protein
MSKIVGIYKIVSPTGSIYIGQSVDCEKRKETYSRGHCKSQPRLFNSIVKHGWDSHVFEIITECEKSELSTLEKYYVDMYGTFNSEHGLNVRDGGGNCAAISEEQKRKTSSTLKGVKHTPERVERNRQAQTGKKHTEETKLKISQNNARAQAGKPLSEAAKAKLSLALKGKTGHMLGKTHTEETREKLRIASSGERNPNFGKPRSEDTRLKIKESVKRNWESRKAV